MLVVITFDEAALTDARACEKTNQADCGSPTGPNNTKPRYSTLLGLFGEQKPPTGPYVYPGGGHVGAVLFNKGLIEPGTLNTTGYYNHYSACAATKICSGSPRATTTATAILAMRPFGLQPFSPDVFNAK